MSGKWIKFDKDDPKTHPPVHELVWEFIDGIAGGISSLGFFDGNLWDDDEDSDGEVTHWMAIEYPEPPEGYGSEDEEVEAVDPDHQRDIALDEKMGI